MFGNPWFFSGKEPSVKEKLEVALEHAKYFEDNFQEKKFYNIKKHLAWYAHGFDNAKELRIELMKAENSKDCEKIITDFVGKFS